MSERLLLRVIFPRLFGISLLDATGAPLEARHVRAAVHASAEGRRSALRQTKSAGKLPPRLKGFLPILAIITKKIRSCPVRHILMTMTLNKDENDRSLKMHTEHVLVCCFRFLRLMLPQLKDGSGRSLCACLSQSLPPS